MIAGLIVAGGKSKRFGSDKRFFELNGKTLFEIACERIRNVSEINYVVLDKYFSDSQINLDRFIIIRDLEEGKGPLMGIYSALSKISEEGCIVIPVDMPELSNSLLKYIKKQAHFYDLVIPYRNEPLPLPGFYSKKLLPYIKAAIEVEDLSIKSLVTRAEGVGKLKVLKLSFDDIKKFGNPEKFLLNINRKEDIDEVREYDDFNGIPDDKLADSYGRNIEHLRISLTDRCNLKCFYCAPRNGINLFEQSKVLTIEEVEHLVRLFYNRFGIRKVRFTGGEPLLRRGIESLFLSLNQIKDLNLHITTNGILIQDNIDLLRSTRVKVNVSIDTLVPDKFKRITGAYLLPKVLKGIDLLIENNIPTKLNTVAIRGTNDDEVFDLIEFARKRDIVLRFIEFMPLNGENNYEKKFISEEEIKKRISKTNGFEFMEIEGAARIYKLGNGAKIGFISTISFPGCLDCSRIRITADGSIISCMFDSNSYSIKDFLRPFNEERLVGFIRQVVFKKPPGYPFLKGKNVKPLLTMRKLGG